ncbi:MAG: 3-keto-5-aminohexanoate cleavage protein, partial [Acidobacteria bacterium]|nr:3-keto-5-aminohexanoate cleavage protein [Acidobacteriota bacterium]
MASRNIRSPSADRFQQVTKIASAKEAFSAGATIMHVHFRQQEENMGRFPSWNPDVAKIIIDAIRDACPGVIINMSTGILGKDVSGPLACLNSTM